MGLDAVVYRKLNHLDLGEDLRLAKLDPETGEVYFESEDLARKYAKQLCVCEHHLGNISKIAECREEVSQLLAPESHLLRKVLYSGTHCGDWIRLSEMELLSTEIESIRRRGRASEGLRELLTSVEDLLRAANSEGNPIVFV